MNVKEENQGAKRPGIQSLEEAVARAQNILALLIAVRKGLDCISNQLAVTVPPGESAKSPREPDGLLKLLERVQVSQEGVLEEIQNALATLETLVGHKAETGTPVVASLSSSHTFSVGI